MIYADWGNKDVQDVLAGVDYAVGKGIADPDHLGVGGWSYGGILTNYVIASDTRFKAAVSGAGSSNIFAGYGTDMYVREYDAELGPPWKSHDTYLKLVLSRSSTPTGSRRRHSSWRAEGLQRATAQLGADVPGAAQPGTFRPS